MTESEKIKTLAQQIKQEIEKIDTESPEYKEAMQEAANHFWDAVVRNFKLTVAGEKHELN